MNKTEKDLAAEWAALTPKEQKARRVAVHLEFMMELKRLELMFSQALVDLMRDEDANAAQYVATLKDIEAAFSKETDGHGRVISALRRRLELSAIVAGKTPNLDWRSRMNGDVSRQMFLASMGIKPCIR